MKLHLRLCAVLVLSLAALLAAKALAKGPVDRLTVDGPGLGVPIGISDAADMETFNPGSRAFIAWDLGMVAAPPSAARTYTVSFFLEDKKVYVLEYAPDPSGGPGYIYLPGPGHPDYRRNVELILTNSTDPWDPNGHWQYAAAEWETMIEFALQSHRASAPAPASTGSLIPAPGPVGADAKPATAQTPLAEGPGPPSWVISVMAFGLILVLAAVVWGGRQHRPG